MKQKPLSVWRATRCAPLLPVLTLALTPALAQTAPPATLKEITVTGNPLGATDLIAPAASLSGARLLLQRESTLGETLSGTPGVSSTYYGPNASRPVIRGQDGDRIRILQNGGGSVDASGVSYDHAVPMDPLTVERVEVLRGPGALLYGGSAIGGVVNVIDNRIPREALFDDAGGLTGRADLGLGSGDRSRHGGVMLEGGTSRYALHVDASARRSGDVAVPVDLACTRVGAPVLARRICNSAAEASNASVGGSVFFERGFLGASLTGYRSRYGTVAEDNVTIDMHSSRKALEGQVRLGGLVESLKAQWSQTDYEHTEIDTGAPKTLFRNRGSDLRVEARHAPLGGVQGVWGLQAEDGRFSADGAEAFAPYTRSTSTALFAHEELAQPWGRLSAGARIEQARVQSDGNPTLARFVTGSRSFSLGSYALGALWRVAPGWQLSSNLGYSERAPKDYELFANGPHGATGAYEVGNAGFGKERATSLDAGLQWSRGPERAALTAFVSRFRDYIYLDPTGNTVATLPEFAYRQVQARFTGLEASGSTRLLDAGHTLDLELRGDLLRADNLTLGQPLPRIAPARVGATLVWAQGPWGARLGFDSHARQSRVPVGQLASDGYTLWNAALTWRMKLGTPAGGQVLWYARLDNVANRLAYSATSILTQTAPGKAPLPGRSVKLGLQLSF